MTYLKQLPQKLFKRKTKKLLKKIIAYRNGSQLNRFYGIVIRIYTLSIVCLPYCVYFVSFAELKQYTAWYKSQYADGLTRKLPGLQLFCSHLRIILLQELSWRSPEGFQNLLCSSANVSKLRKFREKIVLIRNGDCHLDMFQ